MGDEAGLAAGNPMVETQRSTQLDPVLEALDPDRGRPDDVVCSHNLSLGFGAKTVISKVDIAFRRGTITALIGPTGSGKSTFLRTVNRMNDKVPGFRHQGDVTFDDQSIWSAHHDLLVLRRRIGMLFQRPNPFPMSIRDNVTSGLKFSGIRKKSVVDEALESSLRADDLVDVGGVALAEVRHDTGADGVQLAAEGLKL